MSAPDQFTVTPQTRVRRSPARASYDRADARAILDEALVASVGIVQDGQPFVIPMAVARDGERLLLHAASSSRMGSVLRTGARICVTVTLLDGIVFARSAMHHSLNYRSVVVMGSATEPRPRRRSCGRSRASSITCSPAAPDSAARPTPWSSRRRASSPSRSRRRR